MLDLDAIEAAEKAKYAAELDRCCVALERWEAACGCNGRLCVSGHIGNMTRRLREQDAEIARLRYAVGSEVQTLSGVLSYPLTPGEESIVTEIRDRLRAALESKGGES